MNKIDDFQIARFWMNVKIDNSTIPLRNATEWFGHCWIWHGSFLPNGYGRFGLNMKSYKAHRVAYFIIYGEIPKRKLVCHKCDNPSCVNPEHLFVGSPRENTLDMLSKGRLNRERSVHRDSISKYPGISLRKEKKSKPWRARIMRNYQTLWVKEFSTEEEAHKARQAKLDTFSS